MIDQLLYEKYVRRRGSIDRRFGEALASFVEQHQRHEAVLTTSLAQRALTAMAVTWLIVILLGMGVVLSLVYWQTLFG